MYHVINAPPPGTPYPELWVPRERFATHMAALARAGYQGVTLDAVDRAWRRGCRLPRRPVVISFDDGYTSQSTNAAPILRDHGWPGVLNLEVKNVGLAGGLTERQVRKLIGLSWEIDSHTVTHPDVSTLGADDLRREIAGSRRTLRRLFGVPVDFFAYPAGRYSAAAQAAVRAAGYRGATTTAPGIASPAQDRTILPRVRVNGDESAAALMAQLGALGG
jgi:peptidoglycan/xylan/chitin deacetylase (PgdA/CDA1 family)